MSETFASELAEADRVNANAHYWVQVRGKSYGPYAIEEMAHFLAEGRVRPTTLVSEKPDGDWTEAHKISALRCLRTPKAGAEPRGEPANIFVHAEIMGGSWNAFLAALETMGAVCELAPGLWLVRTRFSAGAVRNALSQTLARGDRFVVVDSTRDRFAWFNLGPEVDVRISQVWNAPLREEDRV